MGVLVLHHALGDLAGERVGNRDIDVIGRDGEGLNQQRLDQQAGGHLARSQGGLEVPVQRREELLGEGHVGCDAQVVGAGGEALHVLELHAGQLGELLRLVGEQGADRDVVVVGLLLALDHDGVDAAVGVFVIGAREVGQRIGGELEGGGGFRCSFEGRHGYREHVRFGLTVTISSRLGLVFVRFVGSCTDLSG